MVAVTAAAYQAELDGFYTDLEALDTSGYRWSTSDRFTRARYIDPERGSGARHLEAWLDLGGASLTPGFLVHSGTLAIVHRYAPDDDAMSQARIHAATRAVMGWLTTWSGPSKTRSRPASFDIQALSAEWVVTTIEITFHLPRAST